MNYRYLLILIILMSTGLEPAFAQDTRYRVEVVVLRLLEQDEPPLEREELTDYSAAIDFLTPAPEDEQLAEESQNEQLQATEIADVPVVADPADEPAGEDIPDESPEPDPNRLLNITEMSSIMQEAWRRLRLSGPFRPEQYLSWEQGSEPPFPTLRLHDLETVKVDDPWADYRQPPMTTDVPAASGGETVTVFADAAGLSALNAAEQVEGPQLPDPVYYYRLDGTVNLTRSRFLHLSLDLQLRQPVQSQPPAGIAPASDDLALPPDPPSSFLVYELKQNRQVRTGRMEYFDGPVLGVLAYITEVVEEAGDELD